ncbi:MAG TPA: hypothetical protein VMZ11_03945 [Mycobacteriales bacterium]|nr:hypothetical protein [Mycobacteriales bacterium]
MTSATFESLGPVLVSELPPVTPLPGLVARVRLRATRRVHERRFERAVRMASPGEASDLLAVARRG